MAELRLTLREAVALAAAAELVARLPKAELLARDVRVSGKDREAMVAGARKITALALAAEGELAERSTA